ncbi:MAG: hypothetical protein Q7U58_18550 [Hydrogenophaga sp.]|nr:hypothetical protein [Hydrogenophaga sp.]
MIRIQSTALCASILMALTACGGGDDAANNSATPSPTLTGLAATGAAISNAPVTARCVAGDPLTGNTDANGVFTLTLSATHTAPCMLEVVNGASRLYSFATEAGRVNITPATDLVLAHALKGSPADVFAGFNKTTSDGLLNGLAAAKTYVKNQLKAVTGVDYAGDPIADVLVVGDADDKVLDALGSALDKAGKTFTDLRTGAGAGTDLATILPKDPGNGGGGGTLPTCNTSLFSGGVRNATAQEIASFGTEYTGEAGMFNDNFEFQKTGSVSLALSAAGALTVNAQAQTVSSVCMETGASQLVVHFGAHGHVDLKAAGKFNGVLADGTTVIRSASSSTEPVVKDWGTVTIKSTAFSADRTLKPNRLPDFDIETTSFGSGRKLAMRQATDPLNGASSFDSVSVRYVAATGQVLSASVIVVPEPTAPVGSTNYYAVCELPACNGITVDASAGTVTFADTELKATVLSGNPATARISGTFSLPDWRPRAGTTVTAAQLSACKVKANAYNAEMSDIACLAGTYVGTDIDGAACTVTIDTAANTFRFKDGVKDNTFALTVSGGYNNLSSYYSSLIQSASMSKPGVPLETISLDVAPLGTGQLKVIAKNIHGVGGTTNTLYYRQCRLDFETSGS